MGVCCFRRKLHRIATYFTFSHPGPLQYILYMVSSLHARSAIHFHPCHTQHKKTVFSLPDLKISIKQFSVITPSKNPSSNKDRIRKSKVLLRKAICNG